MRPWDVTVRCERINGELWIIATRSDGTDSHEILRCKKSELKEQM